jgi:UDP-3-O-[3-hydroxymyristoyl] glucosamine N-acyltransferase
MPTANSTPLNLDTITSAQNNQIVNVNAYYQANVTPATPAGGTYNFTTFVLTPPSGWTSNIPSSGNTSVYVSTATFVGNTNATAALPATDWTVPTVYSSQFQGNTGPAGTRGFVPMGFVITASDPTSYSNAALTTAYSSSRTNPSPPIGLGFAPIQYDTAQFAYQNLFTGNTTTIVKQYDGTGWASVVGDVISGGLFVPGSINANTLNVNQVYALTIASTNANVGNVASNGFWLQASTGDARFGGNVSIGANLTVEGLITVGSLNANTVGGAQIVPGSITGNLVAANTIFGNSIVANSFAANTINGGAITANSISANALVAGTIIAANSIQSANATFGSFSSPGYWLDSTTGNVRMAGNTSIGNNLTVGNNAVIGNSLRVGNALLVGNFAEIGTYLVVGNNAQVGSSLTVGTNAQIGNNLSVGASASIGTSLTVGTNARIGSGLNVGTNAYIGGNLNVSGLVTAGGLNTDTVNTVNIVGAAVTNQGTNYSKTTQLENYGGGTVYAWTDSSTTTSVTVTNITSGAILSVTARSMGIISATVYTTSVIQANLALMVRQGSATPDPIAWANVQQTCPPGTAQIPSTGIYAGDLEVYQALYPYTLTGNATYTIFAQLFGRVISGNATMTGASFNNYSPLTSQSQVRFITAQTFKR